MKQLTSQIHAFGKALMVPIPVIAAAGIFLGLVTVALHNRCYNQQLPIAGGRRFVPNVVMVCLPLIGVL